MPKNDPLRRIDNRPVRVGAIIAGGGIGGVTTGGGVTDHGALTGLADDDHIQYLNTSRGDARYVPLARYVTAGAGLSGGGQLSSDIALALASTAAGAGLTYSSGVLNIGAGLGITVNADDVALAASTAGDGLTYASGVLNIGQGLGITVNANDINLASTVAGNGLTYTLGVLDVGVANTGAVGLTAEANAIRLTSSSNPGAAASVLATDSFGSTQVVNLFASYNVFTPEVGTISGSLTLRGQDDLVLSPGSAVVKLYESNMQADNYASQTTGWRISWYGEGDFRYLYTDELHAKSFIADLEQALAGGQIISKSVSLLALQFTAPAAGASATLWVRDLPSAPNMAVFQSGDYVRLRSFSRSAGSLTIADCWGTVSGYTDQGGNTQTWTFTRSSNPNAGTMAAGTVIETDAIVLDYGTTGNGFYEVNAIDGAYGSNSPYAQIVTWTGHPRTQTVRTRMGRLYGLGFAGGNANEYGLYAGGGTANTDSYLRISNDVVRLNNVPLQLWNGADQTVNISSTGTDVWIGTSSAAKKLEWNGSTLTVRGAIVVQSGSSGYGNLSDKPTSLSGINSTEGTKLSGIASGATVGATWGSNLNGVPPRFGDSPTGGVAGLYMTASNMGYWDGSNWKTWMSSGGQFYFGGSTGASLRWSGTALSGYDGSNNEQWYASATDGKLYAGSGNVRLATDGIRMLMQDSVSGYNELKWAYTHTSTPEFRILAIRGADNNVTATISTQAQTAGKASTLYIASYKQDNSYSTISMLGNVSVAGTFSTTTTTTVPSLRNTGGAFYSDNVFWFYNLAGSGYQSIAMSSAYNTSGYELSDSGFKLRNWGNTAWQQLEAGAVYAYSSLYTPAIYYGSPVEFLNGGAAQGVRVASVLATSNYSGHASRIPSYGVYSLGGVRTSAFVEVDSVTSTQSPLATGAVTLYLHYSTIDGKYRLVFALNDGSGTNRYAYINMSNITGSGSSSFIVNTIAPT